MLAQALGDRCLGARLHEREEAVLAGDEPYWAGPVGREQTLRLADAHTLAEEHGDASWAEEWALLAHRRGAFDLLHERPGMLLRLVV